MRLWPGELTLSDLQASEAQSLFLGIIEEAAPEVLEALLQEAYPHCSGNVFRMQDAPADLRAALERWAAKFNLEEPWIYEQALTTLDLWRRYPPMTEWRPLTWGVTDTGEAWWEPSGSRRLSFTVNWDPASETRTDALKRLQGEFKGRVTEVLDEIERQARARGWEPAQVKRDRTGDPLEHFRWLVEYQVLGRSYTDIAGKGYWDDRRKTIEYGIKRAAELCGITLRPRGKGGRPRKT